MTGMQGGSGNGAGNLESLTLLGLVSLVRRHKFLLVAPIVVALAGSLIFAISQPDLFESEALIDVEPPAGTPSYDPRITAQGQISAVRDAINRRSFLEPIIDDFDLYPTEGGKVEERWLEEFRSRIELRVEGPLSFSVGFEDKDPERAAGVVSRVAESFVEGMESARRSRAEDRVRIIEQEVDGVQEELDEHQRNIDQYKTTARGQIPERLDGLISSLNRSTNDLQAINRSIATSEAERAGLEAELRLLESQGADQIPQTGAAQDNRRRDLRNRLAVARSRGRTDQHPEVVEILAELEELDGASTNGGQPVPTGAPELRPRYIQLSAQLESVDRMLEFYSDERLRLVGQSNDFQRQIDAIPEYDTELSSLMREAENARNRYFDRLQQLEQARLDARLSPSGGPVGFMLAEPARVPQRRSGPARRRIVGMGALLGVFLGLGLLLVMHQLDSTFHDIDDLRKFAGLATLASLPLVRDGWFSLKSKSLIPTIRDVTSVASEQYRILSARVQRLIDRECAQIVLVTSSAGSEGKTTTAMNMAVALSQLQPGKVLLIDADLRKPSVREKFSGLSNASIDTEAGLHELITSPNGLPLDCFGRVDRLFVLAANDVSADLFSDISAEPIRKAFARLRKQFKYIIVDAPPLLPMVDSHLLADLADRVLIVVRAGQTRRETLAQALESFDLMKILGLVLNGVDFSQARYGRAYDYYAKEYVRPHKPKGMWGAKIRILL